jgi:hypothetical protein
VDVRPWGERPRDGAGLAVAVDQEPDATAAVEGAEGERDALGRGLGGVGDADGDLVVDVELGRTRSSAEYAVAASSADPASSVEGISWTLAGSNGSRSRNCSRASRALRSSESEATNRSSPHHTTTRDQSTSEPGPIRPSSRCTAFAMDPPVSPICGSSPRAWASSSRVISSPAADVARSAASTWTSIRGAGRGGVTTTASSRTSGRHRRTRRPRRADAAPRPAARARPGA